MVDESRSPERTLFAFPWGSFWWSRLVDAWPTATRQQDRTRIGSVLSVLSVARLNLTDYSDGRVIRGTAYYQTRSSVDSRMILVR
jgi:hypothetical protein